MAQRVSRGGMGMRTRKKVFVAKAPSAAAPTIDGASTAVLTMQYESIKVVSDNTSINWWIL